MTQNIALAERIIEVLDDLKAANIVRIPVGHQTTVTDDMIICTALSSRHVKSMANTIMETLKNSGYPALHHSGLESGEWALVDFGDAVVHIMQKDVRMFYDLEGLWA